MMGKAVGQAFRYMDRSFFKFNCYSFSSGAVFSGKVHHIQTLKYLEVQKDAFGRLLGCKGWFSSTVQRCVKEHALLGMPYVYGLYEYIV